MVDMRKYGGSSFIGIEGVRGSPREETIASIAPGKYDKPVVTFESGAKFTLNATNVNTLIKAYGPNDHDWVGKTIELAVGTAQFNGNDIESVVVRPISPNVPPSARKPLPPAPASALKNDMDDEISF